MLIFPGYEVFDLKKEKDHFNMDKLNNMSMIVTLRYYEYVCIARFQFSFIIPILESGLVAKDVFDMMKHCLRNFIMQFIYELGIYTGILNSLIKSYKHKINRKFLNNGQDSMTNKMYSFIFSFTFMKRSL